MAVLAKTGVIEKFEIASTYAPYVPRRNRIWPVMTLGLLGVAGLIGGLGFWSATTEIAGAVIAPGTVVVENAVKKVQHLAGGVVGEIRVKDGDRVSPGDLLVRLDDTITRANLQIQVEQLDDISARKARLKAERDGLATVAIPASLAPRASDPKLLERFTGERTLFDSRRSALAGQKARLQERIGQLQEEAHGLTAQQDAKSGEIDLIAKELTGLERLEAQNLVPATKMTQMRREAKRLEGERAQLVAAAAQARGKMTETELQIIGLGQEARTEVVKDLRDIESREAELNERRIAAEDQLKRVEIRAPQEGIVHQLAVHTVGGVVNPSEPIMLIVPENDALVIEARLAPESIDAVHADQQAFIRFTAFNQRTTPEFTGRVARVSSDLIKDPQSGQAYFMARIALSEEELRRLGALKLLPGMPAEVHIKTGDRTALSYLMKPLQDQFARAFKER